jgi:hypothetical protein
MPEWVKFTFEYLVGMYMHPAVTAVVFIVLLVSRVRFEEPHVLAAKEAMENAAKAAPGDSDKYMAIKDIEGHTADRISQVALGVALIISFTGQFAFYWPHSGQARALCAFFSFGQVGIAILSVFYIDKFGLIDRFGHYLQRKADGMTPGNP